MIEFEIMSQIFIFFVIFIVVEMREEIIVFYV